MENIGFIEKGLIEFSKLMNLLSSSLFNSKLT